MVLLDLSTKYTGFYEIRSGEASGEGSFVLGLLGGIGWFRGAGREGLYIGEGVEFDRLYLLAQDTKYASDLKKLHTKNDSGNPTSINYK